MHLKPVQAPWTKLLKKEGVAVPMLFSVKPDVAEKLLLKSLKQPR